MKQIAFFLLAMLLAGTSYAQTTDTKDVQIAKLKLRVGTDATKYFTSTTDTITAASTDQQLPTAKAVYEYGGTLGGFSDFISTGLGNPPAAAASDNDAESWRNMTTGEIWRSDGTNWILHLSGTGDKGDIDVNSALVYQIDTGAVNSLKIADGSVALADMANMATASFIYRKTGGSGAPEVNTLATVKTDLGLTGTNSGDQTIALTGDVTGTGTGSFPATIASNAVNSAKIADGSVALADMANMATASLIYRKTAGTGVPEVNTLATLKTDLGITGNEILNGGNSTAAAIMIGTNDANNLDLETNGVVRLNITGAASTGGAATFTNVTTNTAASQDVLTARSNSTGTPAADFGPALLFQGESSTTDNQDMARLSSIWTTPTHGSRTNALVFSNVSSGTFAERFRFTPTAMTVNNNYVIGNSANVIELSSTGNTVSTIRLNASDPTGSIRVGSTNFYTFTAGTKTKMNISGDTYTASSGNGVMKQLLFGDTWDLTGTANGLQSSIDINPTLTNLVAATYAAVNIQPDHASAIGVNQTGINTRNIFRGKTAIGSTTAPTEQLEVTGNALVAGKLASTSNATTLGASATTLAITRNVVKLTGNGTNVLATITGGVAGQILTIIFVDALVSITDTGTGAANTVNLSAAFTSTANDTITLVSDGTSWFEVGRSVN